MSLIQRLTSLLMMGFVASLSLSWAPLFHIGNLAVGLSHLTFCGLAILFLLSHSVGFRPNGSSRSVYVFSAVYAVYLIVLCTSGFFHNWQEDSYTLLLKNTLYFIMFFIVFEVFQSPALSSHTISRAVYFGCPLGLIAFLGFAQYIFSKSGRNFVSDFGNSVLHGNSDNLRFDIFLKLLNYKSIDVDRTADSFVSAARVNTLTGGFILFLQLVWLYQRAALSCLSRLFVRITVWCVTIVTMLLIIGSSSRSNIATMIFVAFAGITGRVLSARNRSQIGNMSLLVFFLACFCVFGIIVTSPMTGIYDMLAQRFGHDLLDDARLAQYEEAWTRIKEKPFVGYGLQAKINTGNSRQSLQVHNLFLAAWYEAGIGGLLSALGFYGYLLVMWFLGFRKVASQSLFLRRSSVSASWWLSLPCLPLVRAMFSGQGGNFSFLEWTSLAFFFAVYCRDRQLFDRDQLKLKVWNQQEVLTREKIAFQESTPRDDND